MQSDSKKQNWTQSVLESRTFQLSETVLAVQACKLTGLTSVSISGNLYNVIVS